MAEINAKESNAAHVRCDIGRREGESMREKWRAPRPSTNPGRPIRRKSAEANPTFSDENSFRCHW